MLFGDIYIWGNYKEKQKNDNISFRIVVILGQGWNGKAHKAPRFVYDLFCHKNFCVLLKGTCRDSFSKDGILVMQTLVLNLFLGVLAYKILQ